MSRHLRLPKEVPLEQTERARHYLSRIPFITEEEFEKECERRNTVAYYETTFSAGVLFFVVGACLTALSAELPLRVDLSRPPLFPLWVLSAAGAYSLLHLGVYLVR